MTNINETIKINTWDDMNKKYLVYREELSENEEKEFVDDCFILYEKETFAKKFWSMGGDYNEYINKPFEVIGRANTNDVDLTCLPMWMIKFEDGFEIAAYPDEIVPREMKNNGCNLDGI